jgi:hypothetical protein
VPLLREKLFRPNPVFPELQTCQATSCLCFGKIAISSLVIFHASLSDEQFPIRELPYHIREVVMGFSFKGIANGKRCIFGKWQAIGRGKDRANISTSVTYHLGVVFKPEKKPLFELTAKWLPGGRSRPRFETGNPPRNRATCNFEEINAIDSRCDHWSTSCTSGK